MGEVAVGEKAKQRAAWGDEGNRVVRELHALSAPRPVGASALALALVLALRRESAQGFVAGAPGEG